MPIDPRDRAAAEELVDYALAGASDYYRDSHRDHMIRIELPFQRFARQQRELDARR